MRTTVRPLSRRLGTTIAAAVAACIVAVALARVEALQAEAEAASVEHLVAQLRTALAIAEAAAAAREEPDTFVAGGNPVALLDRVPWNYVGSFREIHPSDVPEGHWFFDELQQTLVYRVRHADAFHGGADGVPRARFKIVGSSASNAPDAAPHSEGGLRGGLMLRAVEPYRWFEPPRDEKRG